MIMMMMQMNVEMCGLHRHHHFSPSYMFLELLTHTFQVLLAIGLNISDHAMEGVQGSFLLLVVTQAAWL